LVGTSVTIGPIFGGIVSSFEYLRGAIWRCATMIGAAWAVIRPFITMRVFTVIFGRIAKLPSESPVTDTYKSKDPIVQHEFLDPAVPVQQGAVPLEGIERRVVS
jgi:hypothetical protein